MEYGSDGHPIFNFNLNGILDAHVVSRAGDNGTYYQVHVRHVVLNDHVEEDPIAGLGSADEAQALALADGLNALVTALAATSADFRATRYQRPSYETRQSIEAAFTEAGINSLEMSSARGWWRRGHIDNAVQCLDEEVERREDLGESDGASLVEIVRGMVEECA